MQIDAYDIAELDRPALDHIWRNLRPYDREEVRLQGATDANYPMILAHRYKLCVSRHGVPVLLYGAHETARCFWIFMLATNEIYQGMKLFTAAAKIAIEHFLDLMFGKRCLVEVWSRHAVSIRWLRRLGFIEVSRALRSGETFLIMEKKEG